jgi:hypothetical protein
MKDTPIRYTPMIHVHFTMFTLASDDVDSLHQTQLASLILTTDRMQLFYLVVRTYLRLLAIAALSGSWHSALLPPVSNASGVFRKCACISLAAPGTCIPKKISRNVSCTHFDPSYLKKVGSVA